MRLKFTLVTCGADNRHQLTCVLKGVYTPLMSRQIDRAHLAIINFKVLKNIFVAWFLCLLPGLILRNQVQNLLKSLYIVKRYIQYCGVLFSEMAKHLTIHYDAIFNNNLVWFVCLGVLAV